MCSLQALKHKYFSSLPYPSPPYQLPLPTSHVARVLAPELEEKKPQPQGKGVMGGLKRKSTGEGDEGDENEPRKVARKLDFGQ